jgi:hypothetical protein
VWIAAVRVRHGGSFVGNRHPARCAGPLRSRGGRAFRYRPRDHGPECPATGGRGTVSRSRPGIRYTGRGVLAIGTAMGRAAGAPGSNRDVQNGGTRRVERTPTPSQGPTALGGASQVHASNDLAPATHRSRAALPSGAPPTRLTGPVQTDQTVRENTFTRTWSELDTARRRITLHMLDDGCGHTRSRAIALSSPVLLAILVGPPTLSRRNRRHPESDASQAMP